MVRARAHRELIACLRRESIAGSVLLAGLLWLQARVSAYFDGDATFHLGRVRVLLQHGFTNRDIYLADDYFQHIYHSNIRVAGRWRPRWEETRGSPLSGVARSWARLARTLCRLRTKASAAVKG